MNAYLKDLFREIKNTLGRFLSLVIITGLGAASVVGIQAASIDMRNIADKTYKAQQLYDLQLKSTVGFDEEDIAALRAAAGVAAVMPASIFDVFLTTGNENRTARAYSLPNGINTITVLEGRLPENAGECVVDTRLRRDDRLTVGDEITFGLDDMGQYFDVLKGDRFTVVGVVASPLYISHVRGNTSLGDGSLMYYIYLHPDAYCLDVYTDIYLLMDGSFEMDNLTDDYYAAADSWKLIAEQAGKTQTQAKMAKLVEAQTEIDDGWADYFDGVRELEEKIADGWRELNEANAKLIDAKAELAEGQRALEAALDAARAALDEGAEKLNDARLSLAEEGQKAQAEIDEGWTAYHKGLDEYHEGILTLETEEADALITLSDAKRELEEAQEKLDDAPAPEWFVFTRKDGLSFDSYYQDTLRLQKIGYVFPLVFFLVAVMVSLTSMSRMVESQRTQIGIYKALGYRPAAIMMKYLFYALSASLSGGLAGVVIGSRLFPLVITDAYGHLYNMPPIETPVPMFIAIFAVISAVLSVLSVTLATCMGSMAGAPSVLMRPKPPAGGKRVMLEKMPLVWNRLGFFGKVTARNIFRYKRRFIMTLAGVAGCSALLVTAFGLSDSIGSVARMQYGNIIEYDARAYLKEIETEGQRAEITKALPEGHLFIREEAVTAYGPDDSLPASIIIPDVPERLNDFVNLHAPDTWEPVPFASGSVLLTEKLARVLGVAAGDRFTMTYSDGRTFAADVTGVVDNYLHHHIYMSPDVYAELFGENAAPNSVLIFYEDGPAANERTFAAVLLKNENVRAVIHNDELMAQLSDATEAMDVVTVVLIVLACALALVVLFNLTNINISERIRELATIKVLGFNDRELAMYIYRENLAVTLLGIGLGLFAGVFLHGFVLATAEIDILKFPRIITGQSYLFSIALSAVFAVFVNLVMNIRLARIDMVESLKNVE